MSISPFRTSHTTIIPHRRPPTIPRHDNPIFFSANPHDAPVVRTMDRGVDDMSTKNTESVLAHEGRNASFALWTKRGSQSGSRLWCVLRKNSHDRKESTAFKWVLRKYNYAHAPRTYRSCAFTYLNVRCVCLVLIYRSICSGVWYRLGRLEMWVGFDLVDILYWFY